MPTPSRLHAASPIRKPAHSAPGPKQLFRRGKSRSQIGQRAAQRLGDSVGRTNPARQRSPRQHRQAREHEQNEQNGAHERACVRRRRGEQQHGEQDHDHEVHQPFCDERSHHRGNRNAERHVVASTDDLAHLARRQGVGEAGNKCQCAKAQAYVVPEPGQIGAPPKHPQSVIDERENRGEQNEIPRMGYGSERELSQVAVEEIDAPGDERDREPIGQQPDDSTHVRSPPPLHVGGSSASKYPLLHRDHIVGPARDRRPSRKAPCSRL